MILKRLLLAIAVVSLSLSFVSADTDGVWHETEDIRGGIFALDEQPDTSYFEFINPVSVNSTFVVVDESQFLSNTTIEGPLVVNSDAVVSGATTLNNVLSVNSNSFLTGDLTVNGATSLDNNANAFNIIGIDSGAGLVQYSGIDFEDRGNPIWSIGKDTSNNFYIDRAGVANRLTILGSNGNVGIGGVANPLSKVQISTTDGGGFGNNNANLRLDNSNDPGIQFVNTGSSRSVNLFLPSGESDLYLGGGSKGNFLYKIWHAGNDGSGSGLDADTLDGLDSSVIQAGLLDSLNLGSGLTGSLSAGTLTLGTDSSYLQRRVSSNCPPGSSIRQINSDGSVLCETDDEGADPINATPGIQGISAGFGLLGGGSEETVSLSVNTAAIQQRVTGTCPVGQSIRQINLDGSVVCRSDDGDTSATNEIQDLDSVLTQGNSAGNRRITTLADPVNDADAATKSYVDAVAETVNGLVIPEIDEPMSFLRGVGTFNTRVGDSTRISKPACPTGYEPEIIVSLDWYGTSGNVNDDDIIGAWKIDRGSSWDIGGGDYDCGRWSGGRLIRTCGSNEQSGISYMTYCISENLPDFKEPEWTLDISEGVFPTTLCPNSNPQGLSCPNVGDTCYALSEGFPEFIPLNYICQ